jgi:hypothetical protein
MAKKKIKVQGLVIHLENVDNKDYVSLTDIAKKSSKVKPSHLIQNWMKNSNTLKYLMTWERVHNPSLKVIQMDDLLVDSMDNRVILSPKEWIKKTNAVGMIQKTGRGGGTFAHEEIALDFCYWLSPEFKVYLNKEFTRLKKEEFQQKNLEWHISKITDNIEEVRNLLDTIPFQNPARNRIKGLEEE